MYKAAFTLQIATDNSSFPHKFSIRLYEEGRVCNQENQQTSGTQRGDLECFMLRVLTDRARAVTVLKASG